MHVPGGKVVEVGLWIQLVFDEEVALGLCRG